MVRSQGNTRTSQRTSKVIKKRENRNITPSLTLRLRRRLKVARLRSARGPCNVTPSHAVNDSITRNVLVEIDIVLARDGRAVPVSWTPGSRVRRVRAAWRRCRDRGATRGSRRSARSVGRGTGGRLGGLATKGAAIRVVARRPASTVRTLVDRTLVPVVSKTMARVASLMVARVSGGEGDLGMSASPPRLYALEDAFFVRHQRGGRGGDVRGGGSGG